LTATGWFLLAVFVIIATSNAVNLTDGLDGLAAGSARFALGCCRSLATGSFVTSDLPTARAALDLGLVAVGLVGACLGFLWWNAAPARIIMGDTGSLAVGTGLGALCLVNEPGPAARDHWRTLRRRDRLGDSSKVVSFRIFGRRIFRMAPFHHHFELRGWPETTVLIRFWILAGLVAMLGLGIFYGDFLKIAKVV